MPYRVTWKTEGVIWTFYGVVTGEDSLKANFEIYGDPRFDNLRYQLVDVSEVVQFNIGSETVEMVAALDEAAAISNPNVVVAVIAAKSEAIELAELYKSALGTSKWKVRIFSSMEDAEKWVLATL